MKPLRHLFLIALIFAGLPNLSRGSDETAGTVVAARGQVSAARPSGPERPLATKAVFFTDDTVKTGAAARAQLMFRDNTVISLGASAVMKITEYAWDADQQSGAMTTRVEEGTFRVLGGLITKRSPEKFKTQTPAATIGIRGSMYAGSVHRGELSVVFQGGTGIYVENEFGRVEIDTPGFGTHVQPGQPPAEPHRFAANELVELADEASRDEAGGAGGQGGPGEPATALESSVDTPLNIDFNTLTAGGNFVGILTPPAHGQLIDNGDGSFSYLPDEGWSGVDSFSYRIRDASGQSVTETVIITVLPVVAVGGGGSFPPGSAGFDPLADALGLATEVVTTASQDQRAEQAAAGDTTTTTGRFMSVTTHQTDGTVQYTLLANTTLATRGATLNVTLDSGEVLPDVLNSRYDPTQPPSAIMSDAADLVFVDSPAELVYTAPVDGSNIGRTIAADNRNAFYYMLASGPAGQESAYNYQSLAVGGLPTALAELPTTGLGYYAGSELFRYYAAGAGDIYGFATGTLPQQLAINWHSGKFIGQDDFGNIIFGDVVGNQLANLVAISPYLVDLIDRGTGSYGTIYGSVHQGIGLGYSGTSLDPVTNRQSAEWSALSALTLIGSDPVHGTGSAAFTGFAVGPITPVGGATGSDPLLGTVSFNVDRDAGTLSGSLTASDSTNSHSLSGMTIGGSAGSAYVTDQLFLAETGCSGNCVDGAATLLPGDNVLFTDPSSQPAAPYLSWGAWNASFPVPGKDSPMTVSANWSYWLAGERTPPSQVETLIASDFSASYQGDAKVSGTRLDNLATVFNADGTVNLTVDFGARTVDGAIAFTKQNDIDFAGNLPQEMINLGLSGTNLTAAGFSGTISGLVDNAPIDGPAGATALATGQFQGGFYGPQAEAVGGAFSAAGGKDYYWGIFGASRND